LLPLSLYIHIPWCTRKCPYCDFNSHAVKNGIPEQAYIETLLEDLRGELQALGKQKPIIETIFIGGGTPSLLSEKALNALFTGLANQVELSPCCEITLEANPGSIESAKFQGFRQLGVNRLSIGIQSFNDAHLQALGRIHSADEARQAVAIAQQAHFDNLNLDLMFGLPGQTEAEMLKDVETAIALQPTHISFYQLTLEPNTYFHKFPPPLPEEDDIYKAQKRCQDLLAIHGYQQYEISAYAREGFECRHNRNYWQFGDYLGIGAGAHGKLSLNLPDKIIRTVKPKSPEIYMGLSNYCESAPIDPQQLPLEFVMNHLRLKSGFGLAHYQSVTGLSPDSLWFGLKPSIDLGLLIEHQGHISCSEQGWDFLDEILEKFMP
jgi:putative oxygen-independent coproporphyrinogen III oxidase